MLLVALLGMAVQYWSPRVFTQAQSLYAGRPVVANEVIVKLRPAVGAPAARALYTAANITSVQPLADGSVAVLRSRTLGVADLVRTLAGRPEVEYVEPNYRVSAVISPNDTLFGSLWGLLNTGQNVGGVIGQPGADIAAPDAWNLSTGSRANVVAVVDTGIEYTHPDLNANIWSAPSAFRVTIGGQIITCLAGTRGFNAITRTCDPRDDHNHGTHTTGIVGAQGNNGRGVAGVNWTASVMGLKFLGATGWGTTADAINAIEFALQAKAAFASSGGANVRILSNSWGCYCFSQALLAEINKANQSGALFVAAAGNNGANNDAQPFYPASYTAPNVVAVAATSNTDGLASFSNRGRTTVHLGAPGVNILSTVRGGGYQYASGTSMAAPFVAGAAALVLAKCPQLSTAQVKTTLLSSVDAVQALASTTVSGGRLDVARAMYQCQPQAAPTLRSITPNTGTVGTSVQAVFAGANFDPAGTTVIIAPADIRATGVQVSSATRMTATLEIPLGAAAGQKSITVKTRGGTSNALGFAVVKAQVRGLMIRSQRNPQLSINAWNGAVYGALLRLHGGCRVDNPDCTWTYRNGMLLSDRDPRLAINAWYGARHGAELRLHHGCTPSNPDCTWTYRNGMFISDRNPSLAINAWNGAQHGTALRLHAACRPNNPDCTWAWTK